MLGPRRRLGQRFDLLDAQHVGELAGVLHQDDAPRQVEPTGGGHGEEEAHRRHRAIKCRRLHAALGLVDLEAADVLSRLCVGGAVDRRGAWTHHRRRRLNPFDPTFMNDWR